MLTELTKAWPEVSGDDELLGGVLRDIGHACATLDADDLREVRNFLANASVGSDRREGMLVGAIELLDGYRDARTEAARTVQQDELILRDGWHRQVLSFLLEKGRATPSEIKSHFGLDIAEASNALTKLRRLGLVDEPLRDELDGRLRYYRVTPRAKQALTLERVTGASNRTKSDDDKAKVGDVVSDTSLVGRPELWNKKGFEDAVPKREPGKFAEVLRQLSDADAQRFVRALYDWESYICASTLLACRELTGRACVPEELEVAIICSVADRVWDPFPVTAILAHQALGKTSYGKEFLKTTRRELVARAEAVESSQEWFLNWRSWFSRPNNWKPEEKDLAEIRTSDSLKAWTVANALKRAAELTPGVERRLSAAIDDPDPQIRWRVAHVLGAFPSTTFAHRLAKLAISDDFRWASRTAARSLLEMLRKCPEHAELRAAFESVSVANEVTAKPAKKEIRRSYAVSDDDAYCGFVGPQIVKLEESHSKDELLAARAAA